MAPIENPPDAKELQASSSFSSSFSSFFEPRLVRIEVDCVNSSDIVLSSSRNCFCCPAPNPHPPHHSAPFYSHASSLRSPTSTCSATLVPYATSITTTNPPGLVRAFTAEKVHFCTECVVVLKKCLRLESEMR